MNPSLNWRELEILVDGIRPEVEGLFVDRLIVPSRDYFPMGYLKGEWAIRLTGRRQDCILLLSIRARHPYLAWHKGKGPRAATEGTRSAFDLAVQKYLKGAKLLKCQAVHQERTVILWFTGESGTKDRLGLVLVFIPAAPEAFLVSASESQTSSPQAPGWTILGRSRTAQSKSKQPLQETYYFPPDGSQAPPNPIVRHALFEKAETLFETLEKQLQKEAFLLRVQLTEKILKQLAKQASDRKRQSQTTLKEAEGEENWQRYGDLLKNSMGNATVLNDRYQVLDYSTGEPAQIPQNPKRTPQEQVEYFYKNARRNQRRREEAKGRIIRFQEVIQRMEALLSQKPLELNGEFDLKALTQWERQSGTQLSTPDPNKNVLPSKSKKSSPSAWLGPTFVSQNGMTIWVGRNKDENLELTFKYARGNDLWMHVRGRPGAHIVIPLQPGKSAPLETLLDAANLTVFYSGGAHWGKTEVDYTFKKYVKRIKDSSEASYTNNKTLLVDSDPVRRKRLLEQNL